MTDLARSGLDPAAIETRAGEAEAFLRSLASRHRLMILCRLTDFIFFARRGEMVSNRREDHEISMLALHLLQNCMVYINTLMLQRVLARPQWSGRLTARDIRAMTPLIWEHVNPYGRFEFDMEARLPID